MSEEIQPLSAEHLAHLFDVPEEHLRISLHWMCDEGHAEDDA